MEYTKQTWTAPTGTGLSRYAKSAESASHVTLTLDPENLTNSPTPFTMARMAHMEEGIAKAYDTAPPTPWAQYSGKDIPQLPDNVAGTAQKVTEFTSIPSGWNVNSGTPVSSFDDNEWQVVSNSNSEGYLRSIPAGSIVIMYIKCISGLARIYDPAITVHVNSYSASDKWNLFIYYVPTARNLVHYSNSGTYRIKSLYIGTGAYDRLVFDNSYHYRHLLNNAVIPTPQGLYFNGETSYLRSKEPVTLPDVFTFSATVNCAVKSTTQTFLAQNTSEQPTDRIIIYRQQNSNDLNVIGTDGTTASIFFNSVGYFTGLDNTDIDLKVEIDFVSKTIKAYRNGIQFGSTVSAPTIIKPSSNYIYSGNLSNLVAGLLGYMRNICLYDTALTDTQRNWLAQGNTPPILYDVTNYEATPLSANDSRVKTALNTSTPAPIYACRAWVRFNGTNVVSIAGAGNVSSVTDTGTGSYTVNFTVPMSGDNFSAVATTGIGGEANPGIAYFVQHLTNAVKIETGTVDLNTATGAILKDYAYNSVAIFSY